MVKRALAWIRHGEYAQPAGAPSAHLPHGLTPRGQEQARAAAASVWRYAQDNGLHFEPSIDTSRMRRAWETATILGRELSRLGGPALQVVEYADLAERSLGAAANLTIDEIEAVLAADPRFEVPPPGWKRDPRYVLPLQGAESLEAAGQRVARHVVARMREIEAAEPVLKLFVGHGGAFRHAACVLGLLSAADVHKLSMTNGAPIFFELHTSPAGERLVLLAGEWRQRTDGSPLD